MRFLATQILIFFLLGHLMFGCCWHHQHALAAAPAPPQKHCCSQLASTSASPHTSAQHTSSQHAASARHGDGQRGTGASLSLHGLDECMLAGKTPTDGASPCDGAQCWLLLIERPSGVDSAAAAHGWEQADDEITTCLLPEALSGSKRRATANDSRPALRKHLLLNVLLI